MIKRTQSVVVALVLWMTAGWIVAQAPERWIFEGLITESDPVLAPALQSGWVLSGSFLLKSIEMEEQFISEDRRSGRMVGGISESELTVDLYYQVLFDAIQQPGLAGFDFQDNNLEENGRDLFGWFLPLTGQLGETRWSSAWLQIWLMDPEGDMISHVPVKISPYGIEWKSGWFRLTFNNEQGESVYADGRIEVFCPESRLDEQDGSQWYAVAADLSRQLVERDSTIRLLEKELSDVKLRLDGLRRMVDLLVEERSSLQEDNALLKERADAADPDMIEKVAELTAEKSLLETQIDDLSGKNESLLGELEESERERLLLQDRLAALESEISEEDAPAAIKLPEVKSIEALVDEEVDPSPVPEFAVQGDPVVEKSLIQEPITFDFEPTPVDSIIAQLVQEPPVEEPPVEEPPVEEPPVEEEPVVIPEVTNPVIEVPDPPAEPVTKRNWSSRRRGPRKFR